MPDTVRHYLGDVKALRGASPFRYHADTMSARLDLAHRLRQCMSEYGDTPAKLAAAFEIRPQSVDSWLRTGRIGKDRLPALARRYSRSVAWLLGQEGDDEDMLSDDERKLLLNYRALQVALKRHAQDTLQSLRDAQAGGPEQPDQPDKTTPRPREDRL